MKHQKLELTWIGKENVPRLEPRILLEDSALSYHAPHRVTEHDIFDNRLIFGDNLLALKALEQEFTGRFTCIYIDPPFNTGQAMEHYDDNLEHSIWLNIVQPRCELLRNLLRDDGTFFMHLDDNELGYAIVLLDEIFGRANRLYVITFKQGSATGHKAINPGCVNTTNFLIMYAKNKASWRPNRVFTGRERDKRYNQFITNPQDSYVKWRLIPLGKVFAESLGISDRDAKRDLEDYEERLNEFVQKHAAQVVRLARPSYDDVSAAARVMIDQSRSDPKTIYFFQRQDHSDMYFLGGERFLFYTDKIKIIDGEPVAGEPLTTLWDDILSNNLHKEGGVEFPKGKKPESLVKRVLDLTTKPGDWVLDSFSGSGTTGAVAHKMRRRWVMIEQKDSCHTHIIPRMKRIVDGTDQDGVSKAMRWKGGGGFRYLYLAPSLLARDKYGNWIISKQYNPAMLSEALCKHEGFIYSPSETLYWQHGHSTERDFIYVTTQSLNPQQIAALSEEVGENRSLLVCCTSFRGKADRFPNLTLKKIPKTVLKRCEWGKDDYSLAVASLPTREPESEAEVPYTKHPRAALEGQGNLFTVEQDA
jgi:adenine-specific DNA-methyltransferase